MKVAQLIEAKADPLVRKREALSQLMKDLSPEQVVDGLAKLLTPSQIDKLIDVLGLGASKENIEFTFKMLLKALPPELKPERDVEWVTRNRKVDCIRGSMSLFPYRTKTQEEARLYQIGSIWVEIYYVDGKWRASYHYWENEKVYFGPRPMEPAALLAFMKKQVPLQKELFEKEKAALEARRSARKEVRAKK